MKLTKTQKLRLSRFRKGLILGGLRTPTLEQATIYFECTVGYLEGGSTRIPLNAFLSDHNLRPRHYIELGIWTARHWHDKPHAGGADFAAKIAEIKSRKQEPPGSFIGHFIPFIKGRKLRLSTR